MSHQTTHRLVDPAGLTLDSLTNLLQRGGADISAFGVGQARSLAEFRDEVRDGKVALSVAAGDGSVQRTLGVVAVLVERTAADGETMLLLESHEQLPDGRQRISNKLPKCKITPPFAGDLAMA